MGTWGETIFEDDTGLENYDQFCDSGLHILQVESMVNEILEKEYSMDGELLMDGFDEPTLMLVAMEIVAMGIGNGVSTFPDDDYHKDMELKKIDYTSIRDGLTSELRLKLTSCVKKIRDDDKMHLTVLWMESEIYDDWKKYMNDLILRLENN